MATDFAAHAFDRDIGQLRGMLSQMGGLAEQAIHDAINALQRADTALATQICESDKSIDTLQAEVEALAVRIIAGRKMVDGDLREVVAALKIAGVIERIGDYAKNIAKRVPLIESEQRIEPIAVIPAMARIAAEMVHDVLDAFAARDAQAAVLVCERDRLLDDFYDGIFRMLVTYMVENPATIGQVAHLLFVAKNLERIGDHATNVAEMVYFAATGAPMPRTRQDGGNTMSRVKMLLVEDDASLAELLAYHFKREDFDVKHTPDGEEALLLAKEAAPDIVLLDWMVEGLSGIEVCRRLRRMPETANVPIIMLTARGEEEDRVRGLETGADDYVTKPFCPARIGRARRRGAAPRPTGAGGRGADLCRCRNGHGGAQGTPRRGGHPARPYRIPLAQAFPRASRLGVQSRAAARRGMGARQRYREPYGRRAYPAAAQGDQQGRQARSYPHRPIGGLFARYGRLSTH